MAGTFNLGYPRIGDRRGLKCALEGYWKGELSADDLRRTAAAVRSANWREQQDAGIDLIPSNDFSLYDHVLDTVALVGAVPPRFAWDGSSVDLDLYFATARGGQVNGHDVPALDLTRWFDTNYHYLVPEFYRGQQFRCASTKPLDEFAEAYDGFIARHIEAAFRREHYDKEIGPGVYDIHSPRVPTVEEIVANLRAVLTVIDADLLWVNPDCGLKTRDYPEVTAALGNIVTAARLLRDAKE